ncbi:MULTISPECIES: hypothetical protein [Enterococcus]|uniref:hypothetical protein n=1 Tax=Enterococcus TaxID=1350 RepID=UPI001898DC30|nr:hypothetical protein [Enterococcus faecium]MDB7366752.1 hypothetical protein [Enterococcus faecium]MDB7520559.1 hypothetical protein [Enterococcus faecium]MDB7523913.1 hypothetical protein [Enterococcus faecium]MDB7525651.1 hypothetical protein [Enterococcus faecium]MDB7529171.1 hypothetical protein [Enterococcus faecium]
MRTVIQGKEITVTIKSERELDTQEIIAAHQLATGNFEALFIKEDSKTPNTNKEVKTKSVEKDIPKWVQVEITCPVCTHESRKTTKYGNVFTKCPSCKTPLYNKYATGIAGEHDKAGNYYYAQEVLRPRNGELTHEEQELLNAMSQVVTSENNG